MSFTPNKNIETPAHGSDVNTWDVNANSNFTIIDTCFSGTLLLNATGLSGVQALTQTQVQPPTIQISGAPTAAITYTVPAAIGGVWAVRNTTSGGFAVGVASAAGGSTVTISPGQSVHMWCDGTATGMIVVNAPVALTGVVASFAGSVAPSGALLCDGASYTTAAQPNLFAVIGYAYGGSGANFNVPDLRGRVVAGKDGGAGRLTSTTMSPDGNTLGATGGAQTEQAGVTGNASVNGGTSGPNNFAGTNTGGNDFATSIHGHTISINAPVSGVTDAATNVQPTLVLNYIIFT